MKSWSKKPNRPNDAHWWLTAGCRPGVSGSIKHIQINFFFLGSYLSGTSYVQLEWGFQHFSLPLSFFKNVKILPCFSVKHYKLIFSIFYMSNLIVWLNCTLFPWSPHSNSPSYLQVRCMLNIWGVMLFIRMSWIVGQAGIGKQRSQMMSWQS